MTVAPPVVVGELLAKVALGDRTAFRSLYGHAGPKLFAICLRMMRNRDEAEDAMQETFVRIWERSHLYDPGKGAASPGPRPSRGIAVSTGCASLAATTRRSTSR
jgi:Sigma-70 region 2